MAPEPMQRNPARFAASRLMVSHSIFCKIERRFEHQQVDGTSSMVSRGFSNAAGLEKSGRGGKVLISMGGSGNTAKRCCYHPHPAQFLSSFDRVPLPVNLLNCDLVHFVRQLKNLPAQIFVRQIQIDSEQECRQDDFGLMWQGAHGGDYPASVCNAPLADF
jgi:hypothetical protein